MNAVDIATLQRDLDETEAALDWALSVRASVDGTGRVDSVYRDPDGVWRTHEVPAHLAGVLDRARLRAQRRRP